MVNPPPMRLALASMIATAALFAAPRADASPEDLFGYGGRTSAMGATGTAHASGYESTWHNPALAVPARDGKFKLTLGYHAGVFRLDADGPGLPGRVPSEASKGFVIGAELPLPFGGVLKDRLGAAFGFYTPDDVIVRGRVLYPERPQFPMLPDRAQSLMIRAVLGARIGWGVQVGVGVATLAEIVGTVVAATDATGRVGTRVEDQLVATYAPILGLTYDLPESWDTKLRVGLTYRGTLDARFAVVVDGTKLSSLQIPLFNISGLAQYDPAQVAFEVARIDPKAKSTLALQFVYKKWSDFPGVLEPTVVCNEGGAGACGIVPAVIPWSDTFVIRAGAEQGYDLTKSLRVHARAGVFFETSPLPSEVPASEAFSPEANGTVPVPTRYFDTNRLAFSLGPGITLSDPLPPIDIDLWAQHHILLPRTITSNGQAGEASGYITAFGLTGGVKF